MIFYHVFGHYGSKTVAIEFSIFGPCPDVHNDATSNYASMGGKYEMVRYFD
jgi:hypothetical protein